MVTFDEILLDTFYSAIADGGPEFATAIIDAGEGGNISYRNSNREDFISRYEIDFNDIVPARRKFMRKFSILREGMARGFRFLAPDDNQFEDENVGWLNPATGAVEYLAATDGALEEFYLIRYYSDPCNNYVRRIVKPSPYDDFSIYLFDEANVQQVEVTLDANSGISGDLINETNSTTAIVPEMGLTNFTLYQWTGKLEITAADPVPVGWKIKVSGVYHLPVCFEDDWQRFQVDEGGISSFKVRLRELLPVELGIV